MYVHKLVAYTNSIVVIKKAVQQSILLRILAICRDINNVEGMKRDISLTYYYIRSTDENE